jgi:class 3 adenylate cyclase/predicted ATPase
VHCLRCRAAVPADARFCPSCGSPQWRSCSHCGASNQPGDRFCKGCGKSLAESASPAGAARPEEAEGKREAERRNLTVMFCDLVGSVALSTALDAEDLRDLIRAYQQSCAGAIARYDGHIAQYLGDGVLAYFGYPVAHEDDARRAVHAALDTVESLAPLAARWRREAGVTLRVRVGVHSGQAVVGEMGAAGHSQMLATGETPNIAARIQGLAEPDTIVISEATQNLVRGYFRLDPLVRRPVEGIGQPLSLFRVIGRTGASTRLAAVGEESLLPFVGRGALIDDLQQRWTGAAAGRGHAMMLQGEPGMGKSRVLRALRERLALPPSAVVELQCSPYQQSSAFAPLIETIERAFGLVREHSAAERGAALAAALAVVPSPNPAETLTLLADLLSVERPSGHADLAMTPQRQRRRTIELLVELLLQRARGQPLLLVVEDLHWADPSTLDVIDEVVQRAPEEALLVVMTHRPDFVPAWARSICVTQVTVGPLETEAAAAIVRNVNGGRSLPGGLLPLVLARAEGNPLYLEEITRVVLDAGALHEEPLQAERSIPATVQESLAARIDRLGPAKPIAQLAAALGRRFSYELLRVMADMVPTGLEHALEQLVSENLLVQLGTPPQADYSFKHALLRDAAYQSLLRSRRREIHATIARTLVERFPQTCEAQPEVPARHYTEAGDSAEAIALWRKAGERAMARSAQAEATAHFGQALMLVRKLPAGPERTQAELGLLMTLGPLQMATRGYADPSVAQTYREAREICNAIGEAPQLVPVLFGLWAYHVVGGDLRIALYLGDQILRQLQETGGDDGGLLLEAQVVRGVTQYFRGEFEDACATLRAGIALYDPAKHRAHAQVFGQEPGMALHVYLAKALAVVGDETLAAAHAREAARIAEETGHFHTSGFCMTYEMVVHLLAGDAAAVAPLAERCAVLARDQCFPIWEAASQLLGGWAAVAQGDSAGGLPRMREGLSRWRATGTTLYAPYWAGLLAEALAAQGQVDEAGALIDAAVSEEEGGEERLSLAELWRLRAALALQRHGRAAEAAARADLAQAMALSRAQGAGLWLRRAEATLAALEARLQPSG